MSLHLSMFFHPFFICPWMHPVVSPIRIYVCLWGGEAGCVPEDEAYIPTYLEAFPPLPEKGAPGEKAVEPASAWGSKIRPIKASVITQVSHKHSPDYST